MDVRPGAVRGGEFSDPVCMIAAISKKHRSCAQPETRAARKSIVMGLSGRDLGPDRNSPSTRA